MKQILDYFSFKNDALRACPLHDCRQMFWCINGSQTIYYANSEADLELRNLPKCTVLDNPLSTFSKWVYEADDFTMIVLDTQADFNVSLSIFNNNKRRTPSWRDNP